MAKQITFGYNDKDYVLEYSRDSIRQMERGGFKAEDLAAKPMTVIPDLFAGAFLMHHASVKRSKVDKIYEEIGDKTKLVAALIEMYNDTLNTLLEEKESGNVSWTQNWTEEDED